MRKKMWLRISSRGVRSRGAVVLRRSVAVVAVVAVVACGSGCGAGRRGGAAHAGTESSGSKGGARSGKLAVVSSGYGLKRSGSAGLDDAVWVAGVVENGTRDVVAFSASFSVYGADGGTVIGRGNGTSSARSGATVAVGTEVEIPQGKKVGKVVVKLSVDDRRADRHPSYRFTASGVRFQRDRYSPGTVVGEVTSHYRETVQQVQIDVVCLDGKGAIDGGGHTFLNGLGAGQKVGFDVELGAVTGTPARCTAYPTLSPGTRNI